MLYRVQGAEYSEAYTLAVSPDGIHWKPGLDTPVIDLDTNTRLVNGLLSRV